MSLLDMDNILPQIIDAYKTGGWLGVASAGVYVAVSMLRSEPMQDVLPISMQWENLTRWKKWLLVAGVSSAGGLMHMLSGGLPWHKALLGVLVSVVGAMGTRETIKAWSGPDSPLLPPERFMGTYREPPEG